MKKRNNKEQIEIAVFKSDDAQDAGLKSSIFLENRATHLKQNINKVKAKTSDSGNVITLIIGDVLPLIAIWALMH